MIESIKQLKIAIILFVIFTIMTGVLYPLLITGFAQLVFPWQANGSLIQENGTAVGSQLIGQSFTSPNYFWGRPSATIPFPYNAASSAGSNMGPSNPDFLATIKQRVMNLTQWDPNNKQAVPVDLVTASGSGLDPDISPAAAYFQVQRIAQARGISAASIQALIQRLTVYRTFGILGEPRVNVLQLNLGLDHL